jgi:hypothetical protein
LNKRQFAENEGFEEKVAYYEEANKQVAILCNHQKTVSKNFNAQSETLQNFVIIISRLKIIFITIALLVIFYH